MIPEDKIADQVGAVLRDLQACSEVGRAKQLQQSGSLVLGILVGVALFFCAMGALLLFGGHRAIGHGILILGFVVLLFALVIAIIASFSEGPKVAWAVFKDSGVSIVHKATEDTAKAASQLKEHPKEALRATRRGLVFHLDQVQGRAELIMGRRRERVAVIAGTAILLLGMGAGTNDLSVAVIAGLPSGVLPPGLLTSDYFPSVMMMVGASLGAIGLTVRARDEKLLRQVAIIDLVLLGDESGSV